MRGHSHTRQMSLVNFGALAEVHSLALVTVSCSDLIMGIPDPGWVWAGALGGGEGGGRV